MTKQLELFGEPTKLTVMPVVPHKCGRGLGPCAVFEETPGQLRCATCGAIAPAKSQRRNSPTIFDHFIQFLLHQQDRARRFPGNLGT
jgi:hypothetical protein